jgi:ribosomal protein S18 acetylase RimI-like enzyme
MPARATDDDCRDGIEIVGFSPELATAFHDLNVEWLDKYFRVEAVDRAVLANPEQEIVRHGGAIVFAIRAGEPLGTAALKYHGGGRYELTKMAVTARAQGGGIGRLLLAAAIARFHEFRGSELYLESHSSLAQALHLYEQAGFEHTTPPSPSPYQRADVYMIYRRP